MEHLRKRLNEESIRYEEHTALAPRSTFRIGGTARLGIFPDTKQALVRALTLLCECEIPYFVIGKGSNVVFSDDGYAGAVVFTDSAAKIERRENTLYAESGASLTALSQAARDASLAGLAFAHGIPGTVGGAVTMNAGAFGGQVSDVCVSSEYFDASSGKIGCLDAAAHTFGYRTSVYSTHPQYTVLSAAFALAPGDREEILRSMQQHLAHRKKTQPLMYPSAGSVFKRPVGDYAGRLIEASGLKGYTVGGARVSEQHAGFIINLGDAKASDVRSLVEQIQARVLRDHGVALECEIRFL